MKGWTVNTDFLSPSAPWPPTLSSPEETTAASFHGLLPATRCADGVLCKDPLLLCCKVLSPFPDTQFESEGGYPGSAISCPSPVTGIVFVRKSHSLSWKPTREQILPFVKFTLTTRLGAGPFWAAAVEAVLMRWRWSLKRQVEMRVKAAKWPNQKKELYFPFLSG